MKKFNRGILSAPLAVAVCALALGADALEFVEPTTPDRVAYLTSTPWLEVVEKEVPLLQHSRADRWPMIMWHGVGFAPLSADQIQMLLGRGLTQHLRLDQGMIDAAKALQEAGSPVIFMQGNAGAWPYSLAADSSAWAHQFDAGYHYKMAGRGALGSWHGACPKMIEGWEIMADQVRDTLGAYRAAGVTVDAVWMDWEGDPYPWSHLFKQLAHCQRCQVQLPPEVLADEDQYWAYYWRHYQQLYGAYLAGPVREIFPLCSITNWHTVYSTQTRPLLYFVNNRALPPGIPPLFTATNPVAYGNDKFWRTAWQDDYPLDQRHVNQFHMHNLLRQISGDAANRLVYGPEVASFPWVARWCPIVNHREDDAAPYMSREAYREALRHMWLRGIDGMQLFNAWREGYEEIALFEVLDAVAVYDEMLGYRAFLDAGQVMNLAEPAVQDEGVLWSGLRLKERAVVRLFSQGEGAARLEIEVWPRLVIELEAPTEGRTYVLGRMNTGVEILE